jgi:hypothetical protein
MLASGVEPPVWRGQAPPDGAAGGRRTAASLLTALHLGHDPPAVHQVTLRPLNRLVGTSEERPCGVEAPGAVTPLLLDPPRRSAGHGVLRALEDGGDGMSSGSGRKAYSITAGSGTRQALPDDPRKHQQAGERQQQPWRRRASDARGGGHDHQLAVTVGAFFREIRHDHDTERASLHAESV